MTRVLNRPCKPSCARELRFSGGSHVASSGKARPSRCTYRIHHRRFPRSSGHCTAVARAGGRARKRRRYARRNYRSRRTRRAGSRHRHQAQHRRDQRFDRHGRHRQAARRHDHRRVAARSRHPDLARRRRRFVRVDPRRSAGHGHHERRALRHGREHSRQHGELRGHPVEPHHRRQRLQVAERQSGRRRSRRPAWTCSRSVRSNFPKKA